MVVEGYQRTTATVSCFDIILEGKIVQCSCSRGRLLLNVNLSGCYVYLGGVLLFAGDFQGNCDFITFIICACLT